MKRLIFSCFTPFHLITSAYYSCYFENVEKVLLWEDVGYGLPFLKEFEKYFDYVYVHSLCGNKINKIASIGINGGLLFRFSSAGKYLKNNRDNNIFMYYSDENFATHKQLEFLRKYGAGNTFILLEEGIGIYRKYESKLPMRNKIPIKLVGAKTCKFIGEAGYADFVFAKHPEKLEKNRFGCARLLQQSDFLRNNLFLDSIKDINRRFQQIKGSNNILFLGDPCQEDGIDRNIYNKISQNIIDILKDSYNVIVKKHPRESIEPYLELKNAVIINDSFINALPVELLAIVLDVKAVVTHVSSAAHNIYDAKPNVKVIYFYKLFEEMDFDDKLFISYSSEPNIYLLYHLEDLKAIMNSKLVVRNILNNDYSDISILKKLIADDYNNIDEVV